MQPADIQLAAVQPRADVGRVSDARARILLVLAAACGIAVVLAATRWGIGASPDSAVYIGAAQNLLAGRGLTVPFGSEIDGRLTHFPPLYPMLLAVFASAGLSLPASARILAAGLFAANVLLAGMWSAGAAPENWRAAAAAGAAGLFLVSPSMVLLHGMAWSEPLFLLLGFGGLLLLVRFLNSGSRRFLLLSGFALGLAALTRYAGLAFLITAALALLLWLPGRASRRARGVFILLAAGAAPLAAFMLANMLATGTAANRVLMLHPVQVDHLHQALNTLAAWLLLPAQTPGSLKLAVLLVLAAGLSAGLYFQKPEGGAQPAARWRVLPPQVGVILIFCTVYIVFLVVSISLVDANTPLDERILSPLYLAGLALVVSLVQPVLHASGSARWLRRIVMLAAILFFAAAAAKTAVQVGQSYERGIGFNQSTWLTSPALAQVARLPADTVIFSNAPEAVFLHTGRNALRLPRAFNAVQQTTNDDYQAEVSEMTAQLEAGGVLVHFSAVGGRSAAHDAALIEALGLYVVADTADGVIYALAD